MKRLFCGWLAGALLLAGCGGDKREERIRAARCNSELAGVCVDYPKLTDLQYEAVKAECANNQGEWGDAACPAEGRLGTCSRVEDGIALESRYFPPLVAGEMQQHCTDAAGTYTAG